MVFCRIALVFLLSALARFAGFAQPPPVGLLDVKELPKNRYLVTLHNHTGDTLRMLSPDWHTNLCRRRFSLKHMSIINYHFDKKGFTYHLNDRQCLRGDSLIFPAVVDTPIKISMASSCRMSDSSDSQPRVTGVYRTLLWHNIPPHSSTNFRFRSLNKEPLYYFRIAMRSTRTREEFVFERSRPFRPLEAGPPY